MIQQAGVDAITVDSGAVFGGAGTVYRNVIVQAGAIFTPGDIDASLRSQAGTFTVRGDLGFADGSILGFDLGATDGDTVSVSGRLTLDGTLDVTALVGFGEGRYKLFSYTGSFIDNGIEIGTTTDGYNFSIEHVAADKAVCLNVISAIPEPGTTALVVAALSLMTAAGLTRRR